MFQTNSEFLGVIGQFAAIGFVLGFLYDIIRFIRKALGTGRIFAFITDFFAMLFSGLVLLYFAIDTPTGTLRPIFAVSALFGMTVYLITIGKITGLIAGLTGRFISFIKAKIRKYILKPISERFVFLKQKLTGLFGELHQKMKIYREKSHFGLKKAPSVLYNRDNNKMSELCQIGGEERNVIKAKVRKKA